MSDKNKFKAAQNYLEGWTILKGSEKRSKKQYRKTPIPDGIRKLEYWWNIFFSVPFEFILHQNGSMQNIANFQDAISMT